MDLVCIPRMEENSLFFSDRQISPPNYKSFQIRTTHPNLNVECDKFERVCVLVQLDSPHYTRFFSKQLRDKVNQYHTWDELCAGWLSVVKKDFQLKQAAFLIRLLAEAAGLR